VGCGKAPSSGARHCGRRRLTQAIGGAAHLPQPP